MIITDDTFLNMINSPVRTIGAGIWLYPAGGGYNTLLNTFMHTDALKSLTVERVGEESKFFGFGICQKVNVKLIDKERAINISTENALEAAFYVDDNYIMPFPTFNVSEVHRDENTNELSITAYDALYKASNHTVSEINLAAYTIKEFATACATLLGLPLEIDAALEESFNISYPNGANFEGTESIRAALDAIAEATQTIYFINCNLSLAFKRLDKSGPAVVTIGKDKYFTLESGTNRRLATICHATELGDNVSASITESGTTQYIRDNPFLELRDDIATLLDAAIDAVGGLTINQFNLNWRGNFLTELGDKVELITKDNNSVISYIINDVITYEGYLSAQTQWSYTDNEDETAGDPTNLGEAIQQTYARVNKANKQIELVASESSANSAAIAALQINTEEINASVKRTEENINSTLEGLDESIESLKSEVSAKITAEDVQIAIESERVNGAEKVTTKTGFTFDDEGLTVSKSDSEIATQITEDGMKISRSGEEVLRADNEGVKAEDLHATTYLIVGSNSRFENYGTDRTGCFWVGGN